MKGYKGFDKDLKCRDMQYEAGGVFEAPTAEICNCGLHFCEYPLDVFGYYPPSDSRYCEVSSDNVNSETHGDYDSKRVATRLEIGAEIGIPGIIGASVNYIMKRIKPDRSTKSHNTGDQSAATNTGDQSAATNTGYWSAATNTGNRSAATNTGYWSAATNTGNRSAATNTGDRSAATNTGDQSAATNTGDQSAATNTGNRSAATNTGYWSAATNTGYRSAATNTGNQSAATNTGNQSAATNTGYWSAATNTGYWSAATNTGYRGAASVEGQDSVAIATGYESKVKGSLGCAICCVERDESLEIIGIASAIVDGKIIKPNIWYTVENGRFIEVELHNSEQEAHHA